MWYSAWRRSWTTPEEKDDAEGGGERPRGASTQYWTMVQSPGGAAGHCCTRGLDHPWARRRRRRRCAARPRRPMRNASGATSTAGGRGTAAGPPPPPSAPPPPPPPPPLPPH